MEFPKNLLQPRSSSSASSSSSPSSSSIPPHRTQIHPRMISFNSHPPPKPKPHSKSFIFLSLSLLLFSSPFLFYLFSTAFHIHSAPIFSSPDPSFFAVFLHVSPSSSRISLFHFLGRGHLPFLAASASSRARPGFSSPDPDALRGSIGKLVEFAKGWVPRKEWGKTMVQLMATQEELEGLRDEERDKVLECCRQVLRLSGFLFKDEWARVIPGEEQRISSWVAVNYALGNLGREPQETTGIVELGYICFA